jgi:hypothetical protein
MDDPSPTSGKQRRHPPPTYGTFSATKKKKKIDPATRGGRNPPQRPGGEIRPPLVALFVSPANQRTKKKKIYIYIYIYI